MSEGVAPAPVAGHAADLTREALVPTLPPWLWLWIGFSVFQLPMRLWQALEYEWTTATLQSGSVAPDHYAVTVFLVGLVDVWPLLALVLGIIAVFLPHLQARRIERRYRLRQEAMPSGPIFDDITAFLRLHAPHLAVRSNLATTGPGAFVYPISYLSSALAIFRGLITTWKREADLGKALMLHEIAHSRFGEALTFRGGAFLRRTVDLWWVFLLLILMVPLAAYWIERIPQLVEIWQAEQAQAELFGDLGVPGDTGLAGNPDGLAMPSMFNAMLAHYVTSFLGEHAPGNAFNALAALFWMASLFLPLVMAIWAAELSADRFAIAREANPGSTLRLLAADGPSHSVFRWIALRLSHPPASLRRWAARNAERPGTLLLLLLLFPASYVVKLSALLIEASIRHLISEQPEPLLDAIPYWITLSARYQAAPFLVASGAVILAWPLIGRDDGVALIARWSGRWWLFLPVGLSVFAVGLLFWNIPVPVRAA